MQYNHLDRTENFVGIYFLKFDKDQLQIVISTLNNRNMPTMGHVA